MKPTDLLAVVSNGSEENVFGVAEGLARQWSARLTILQLAQQPGPLATDPVYAASLWVEVLRDAHDRFVTENELIQQRIAKIDAEVELRSEEVLLGATEDVMMRHAIAMDLVIMGAPQSESADIAFEGALFRSGRPILLIPPQFRGEWVGKRVLIGWKPKREAARALADAAPFLQAADTAAVVTVDSERETYGAASGAEIAALLRRKGVKAELRAVATAEGESAEDKLLAEAASMGADLIVIGGYGHSRLREFVFGGVTRSLSRHSPIPVLMSH